VRLFYQKVGAGKQVVIIPAGFFLFDDFQTLAKGRTMIFYDMRDRGRSDAVADPNRLSIQYDVDDLETVRKFFRIERADLIGWSYLGMMVVQYAIEHPDRVDRIVQLGAVPRKFGTQYPATLTAQDAVPVPDPVQIKELEELERSGFLRDHPKEFCEKEWQVTRVQLVGNPANVTKLRPSKCIMPNEWPVHLNPHIEASLSSIQQMDIPRDKIAALRVPVLTIHGTQDRNAPYGGGREWSMTFSEARLVTISGAAHMSWVDAPEVVFSSIDTFFNGRWPPEAEKIMQLDLPLRK
jgi:pimeloyl-ACP methyl ester carboxylesterase